MFNNKMYHILLTLLLVLITLLTAVNALIIFDSCPNVPPMKTID